MRLTCVYTCKCNTCTVRGTGFFVLCGGETIPFPSTRAGIEAQRKYRDECAEVNAPCWLCGQSIDYEADASTGNPNAFNADHRIPTSVDPDLALDPDNFAPAHAGCNKSRGNKVPEFALGTLSESW